MEVPTTKPGFPDTHRNHTVCPFCGDVCHETVDASSSFALDSVHTSIGFRCMSGCWWEIHIVSEEGDLGAHCVLLMGIHEELREQRRSETIMSSLKA
jgi:hypothetical protein